MIINSAKIFAAICLLFVMLPLSLAKTNKNYKKRIIKIEWGLKTTKNQIWDGNIKVSKGSVLAFPCQAYSQNEIDVFGRRISKSSWEMQSNFVNSGIYLILRCPPNAIVTIDNKTFPFTFKLKDLKPGGKLEYQNGNIKLRDKTGIYLYARAGMETGVYGEGEATIEPPTAVVNTLGRWKITFTVGENGIPAGGGIRISHHFSRSWGSPQYENPKAINFVSVKTTNDETKLDHTSSSECSFDWPHTKEIALVRVIYKPLVKGDQVIISLGDKTEGCPGYRPANTNETVTTFRVETCSELSDNYFPIYRRIKECPRVDILPGKAEKLYLVIPSIVALGEPFLVMLRAEDKFRNVAINYEGRVSVYDESGKPLIRNRRIKKEDRGVVRLGQVTLKKAGIFQLEVRDEQNNLEGISNPVYCQKSLKRKLYWGETHCHTQYSDGYGTKDELYTFLRDVAHMDFAVVSDHDVEDDTQDYTTRAMWVATQHTSSKYNVSKKFVTFPGWEWSPHRNPINGGRRYGDHNVIFLEESPPRRLLSAGSDEFKTLEGLFGGLDFLGEEAIVISHVGGKVGNWGSHSDKWQPLGEICSVHGSFEAFGRLAIGKYGRKVGFVGGGDNHNGMGGGFPPSGVPGHFTHGGLAGVYSGELTRSSILAAMKTRRTYATSGPRILLDFNVNGHPAGSDIQINNTPILNILARGVLPLWKVDIIKDGKAVKTWHNDQVHNLHEVTLLWRNWITEEDLEAHYGSYKLRKLIWNGNLQVYGTDIVSHATRSFHHPRDKILSGDKKSIKWNSLTHGDYDGITIKLKETGEKIKIGFNSSPYSFSIKPYSDEMKQNIKTLKINDTDEVVIIKGALKNRTFELEYKDMEFEKDSYYYIRATQIDGEEAWSSPVFVTKY